METIEVGTDHERLNASLWRSRAALDRLEFLLEMQLLLLADGRTEWQHQMAELMDEVTEAIALNDLEREMALSARSAPLPLRSLAEQAPEPWSVIFADHLVQLEATVARIEGLRNRASAAITVGQSNLADLTSQLTGRTSDGYGQDGRRSTIDGGSFYFDGRA